MITNIYDTVKNGEPVIVAKISDFNPIQTLANGQCFRWFNEKDGSYTGIAGGKIINVYADGDECVFRNVDMATFHTFWREYFDFETDYDAIKRELRCDSIMDKAIEFGWGIRILRQDVWEMLISFIISANNSIPSIIRVVSNLSRMYGHKIARELYTFPEPIALANAELKELEACKAGFRCKYIKKAGEMIVNGEVDLYNLNKLSTEDARSELQKIPGVGEKVADCVLLYSGIKQDVFPTDVWIKRIMETLYLHRSASLKEIQEFSNSKFGALAGFAQIYLFYYARQNKIGA